MKNKKIAVGLSGGVDSSVAAKLLLDLGYSVTGVYIEAYNEPGCRTDQDKKDALKVALQLGIPFEVYDARKEYRELVIGYFYHEYEAGRTPNPDIVCNREIKFGIFYDYAMNNGFDYVATGHYARIANTSKRLQRAVDVSKDQSYFLAQIDPQRLEHVLFPLGEMTKKEVRAKAKEWGLPTANKPDSMGICFVGEVDVAKMLSEKLGEKEGKVMMKGQVVGSHKGIWTVTPGQKVGKELSLDYKALQRIGMDTTNMPPLFVVGKDGEQNVVTIGTRQECYRSVFGISSDRLRAADMQAMIEERKLFVRIRNLGELSQVIGVRDKGVGDAIEIETGEPVFAPAPGQMAVLYYRQDGVVGNELVVDASEIVYI